jgi:ABC-type nitrate/sulfonate/bicarbonate transport system permease component
MNKLLTWILFVGSVFAVWQGVASFLVSPAVFASPIEVLTALPRVFGPDTGDLITGGNSLDVWSTLWRSLLAFLCSVPLGVSAGFLVFYGGRAAAPTRLTLDFLRSIPATALVPVFIILVGINDQTKVVVGAFSSALVIALATIAGLEARNTTRLGVARVFGLTRLKRLYLLDLPEASPQIFVGLRAGISLALVLVVVSEMLIGGSRGLGRVIYDMSSTDDKPKMYAAMVVTGAIGYLFNSLLILCEHRLLHWKGR